MTIEKSPYIVQRDIYPSVKRLLQVFSDVFYVEAELIGMSLWPSHALKIEHTTIEEQKMLRLVIISSNGNIFKNGNVKTLLSAKVYSWDEDITDTLDANQFVWTRVSEDTEADKVWNEQHFGGAKSVAITGADVKVRATFYCDLIDTTTRQSLL